MGIPKETVLEVQNVSKTFLVPSEKKDTIKSYFVNPFHRPEKRKFHVLNDISFEIQKGEFFGIIGRNGSGKSTLLKIIAGIYLPDQGDVVVNGTIVPFLELGVGFNPELSGRENIFLNGTILGMSKSYLEKKFVEIVNFAEIGEFIDLPLKNYSSGMQVRLAFSIAIQADADVYLMDEVLAVGDTNFQTRCLEIFNSYKRRGKTVILVTHDTDTVEKYCDRALLIREGKVSKIGDSSVIVDEYTKQNMQDEEARLSSANANKVDFRSRIDSRSVEIEKLEFMNDKEESRNTFETGEDVQMKIYLKKNSEIEKLNVGISLESDEGTYIFGYNTQMDTYKVDKDVDNVTFTIKKMPLLGGLYFVNVVCFGSGANQRYDFRQRFGSFKVYTIGTKSSYKGFIDLDHRWDS